MGEGIAGEIREAAETQVAALLEEFPGLEKEMGEASLVIYSLAGHYPLREIIYRSLMTGATLTANKYRAAREGSEDVLANLMKK